MMAMILLFALFQATIHNGTINGGTKVEGPSSGLPPVVLTAVAVAPVNSTVSVGSHQYFTAGGTFSDGTSAPVTTQCVWISSNTAVATIGAASSPQLVNAVSQGTSQITCTVGNFSSTVTLTVSGIAITTTYIPLGIIGNPYTATFTASGGTQPYTFSITTGLTSLTGLGLSFTSPSLSGTPTATGNYGFTLTVQDSSSTPLTATYNYVLQVNPVPPPSVAGGYAQLPQVWVDSHECDPPNGVYDVNKVIHNGTSGDYACTMAGLNQAIQDWASSGLDQSERIKIDSTHAPGGQCRIIGATGNNVNAVLLYRTKLVNGNLPNKCLVIESSTPNPKGETVCAGVGNAGDPLLMVRNPGCANGPWKANMWYLSSNSQNAYGNILQFGTWDPATNWGPNHIVMRDVEVDVLTTGASSFVLDQSPRDGNWGSRPGQPRPNQRQYGTDIGLERSYLHGDYGDNARSARGLMIVTFLNFMAGKQWFMWNYTDGIAMVNTESHITGDNYSPPGLKIASNWIEGGNVNMFWGGSTQIATIAPPSDMELRRNVFTKNPAWMFTACGQQGAPLLGMKGIMEFKNGMRVLINGNIYQYAMVCGQAGQLLTFNTRASSGGIWGDNYNVQISDITVTNNIFRYANAGIQMDGRSGGNNAGQGSAWPARRWSFINNLWYALGNVPNIVPGTGSNVISGGSGILEWFVYSVSRVHGIAELVLGPNTGYNPGPGTSGIGMKKGRMSVGDPVTVTGCGTTTGGVNISSFLTPNPTTGAGPRLTDDTTDPDGLTISYPNAGPDLPVTLAAGAACRVTSRNFPQYLTVAHNTAMYNSSTVKFPNNAYTPNPSAPAMINSTYQDNLITPQQGGWLGWSCCGQNEGNNSARVGWDINTLTIDHNVWPSRFTQRGSYTQRHPACTAAGNCLIGTSIDPALTLWFPQAVVCPNATVGTSDCIGYHGMMNGAPYLLNSPNPLVDYSLVPDSPYRAGGPREAHDHTDMGVSMPALQNAFGETKYSGCSSTPSAQNYCGPTGPFPD